ncbi:hypothetical protein MACK_002270 [Theileria orientalis]|uniref:Uncharacterized protein n=1 Tax=Theileria orientalis TaxID=68886 RepID=A0A976MBY1_THEOR|nr:hypothetical protein MACK_002270 [Theileria orientalis]
MLKTTNQIHFIYITMRIPIILITNIICLFGIINSNSTPEKFSGNQAYEGQNVNQYITIDISSTSPVNSFYFINSQINGVDTVIFFPNSQNKVRQIRDQDIELWTLDQNEQFIIGFISKQIDSQDHIIHLMINTQSGIKKLFYQYTDGKYSQIDTFRYLDIFTQLKPNTDRTPLTLDLSKDDIPEIMDKGAILGKNHASLFIPKSAYKVNRIVYGELNVYDGSALQTEVPIAIAYEIQGSSYLDLMSIKEGQNTGHIHSYQFSAQGETTLISSSDVVSIFDIFIARVFPDDINQPIMHPRVREIRRDAANTNDIMEVNLDIKNVDSSVIHTDEFKVLNIKTIKYSPLSVIITSVSYGKKQIWRSSEDEIQCKNVIAHYVNDILQTIEISILDNLRRTTQKLIPFQSIIDEIEREESSSPNLVIRDGKWDFEQSSDFDNEAVEPQHAYISTPPNSPTAPYVSPEDHELRSLVAEGLKSIYPDDSKSTPPNSPARTMPNTPVNTPPPSPMSSLWDIYYPDAYTLNNNQFDEDFDPKHFGSYDSDDDSTIADSFDSDDELHDIPNYKLFIPIHPPAGFGDHDSASLDSYNEEDQAAANESMYNMMFDYEYIHRMHQQDEYDDEYRKNFFSQYKDSDMVIEEDMILNIASKESIYKLFVIDGRKYVPFIFLMPHYNQKIEAVVDDSQTVWDGREAGHLLKYVSLFLDKQRIKGMYLMISQDHVIVNKYFIKKGGKWIDITLDEYMKATKYNMTKDPKMGVEEHGQQGQSDEISGKKTVKSTKDQGKSKDRVLHVSIMIPVIIGSLFFIVSVCSLFFILFFC